VAVSRHAWLRARATAIARPHHASPGPHTPSLLSECHTPLPCFLSATHPFPAS
jgi:hypothetical protein